MQIYNTDVLYIITYLLYNVNKSTRELPFNLRVHSKKQKNRLTEIDNGKTKRKISTV